MNEALIIDAGRTPHGIGRVGKGALAALQPQHLAATVLRAIAERNAISALLFEVVRHRDAQASCPMTRAKPLATKRMLQ